jgi:hypothetical protein
MTAIAQVVAVLCAGLFAGSALYESLVASRATLALVRDDPAAQFARGFRASGAFQAPLVLVGGLPARPRRCSVARSCGSRARRSWRWWSSSRACSYFR